MTWSSDVVGVAKSLAAAVLLVAGTGKLVQPRPTTQALSEVLRRKVPRSAVSTAAACELVTAAGLLASGQVGRAALASTIGLGSVFLGIGLLGRIRRTEESCGCFGVASRHPFGLRTIASGALFVSLAVFALIDPDPSTNRSMRIALCALFALTVQLFVQRAQLKHVVKVRTRRPVSRREAQA
jgi:DoxX-like family